MQELASDTTDRHLLQRVQAGDVTAFERLFRSYSTKVYRQAMHLVGSETEAEEVMQEVFLTVYEKAHTFRGEAAFSTWLYRLTVNAALSRLRRRRRRPEVSLDEYLPRFRDDGHHLKRPVVDWSRTLADDLTHEETRTLLYQAIEELKPLDKAVIMLSDLEELSNRQVADILGVSISAVKSRLHRARLFLRGKLAVALAGSHA